MFVFIVFFEHDQFGQKRANNHILQNTGYKKIVLLQPPVLAQNMVFSTCVF